MKYNKNFKKGTIFTLSLSIFAILFLGVCVMWDKKTAKEESAKASEINENEAKIRVQKEKEEEEHKKALRIFDGLTLSTFGDSITAQGLWQPIVKAELGFKKFNNLGIGGSKVSGSDANCMCEDERINKIPSDSNVIIFMGGTNDWGQNIQLGSIGSKDTNTFYGAVNVVADKLTAKFPKAKIIFMSTTFTKNKTGLINDLQLKNSDYGLAVKNVANERHFTFIDLSNLWNETNIGDYVKKEDNAYIHPNEKGGKKMSETIVNQLRKEAGVQ